MSCWHGVGVQERIKDFLRLSEIWLLLVRDRRGESHFDQWKCWLKICMSVNPWTHDHWWLGNNPGCHALYHCKVNHQVVWISKMITGKIKGHFVKHEHNMYEKLKRALRFIWHHWSSNWNNMCVYVFKIYMYTTKAIIYVWFQTKNKISWKKW